MATDVNVLTPACFPTSTCMFTADWLATALNAGFIINRSPEAVGISNIFAWVHRRRPSLPPSRLALSPFHTICRWSDITVAQR
jgi:hypothetical protein